MMRIGGIELDNEMYWIDEFQYTPTAGTTERTIDGHVMTQVFNLSGGRLLTIAGTADSGWQQRSTVTALQALAETPEQPVTVEFSDGRSFTAYFRVEDQPVMSFEPITIASEPGADFWYYGTINLRIE